MRIFADTAVDSRKGRLTEQSNPLLKDFDHLLSSIYLVDQIEHVVMVTQVADVGDGGRSLLDVEPIVRQTEGKADASDQTDRLFQLGQQSADQLDYQPAIILDILQSILVDP
ncbi:MAG: hypothetical protein JSV89_14870 [Spirochaetaceae bacterium]|nr:MAG: hypothetical protein JSV89_14870 [Spirochaetaceae bacterium]